MANITLQILENIAELTFDRPGSPANIFDRETLEELSQYLTQIASDSSLKGLVITSAKPNIFIAGADLHTLSKARDKELESLIQQGQDTFEQLANLTIPTVAAIHGACVGGGLELALACDWRVASDSGKTRLGLPETQLGILPAWGGSTRLPRLVGLPTALALILPGKLLKPIPALKKGLVDALAPRERLMSHAHTFLGKGKRCLPSRLHLHNPVSAKIIAHLALKNLHKKTRGLYPAPERALQVATRSLRVSHSQSLHNEREAILHLAPLPVTRNLIKLYFLNEKSRKLALPDGPPPAQIGTVAVIGAGVMGAGIAYWLSTKGHPLLLQDLNHQALAKGIQTIDKLYAEARKRHVFTAAEAQAGRDLIHPITPETSLHKCDLVIEAAVENLEIKQKIFADLSARTRPETLLATNTSALPIHELASHITAPGRLLGLHFFNPVPRMQLIEVIQTPSTSPATLATALAFTRSIGKLPVLVQDSPGFIVNRILLPYLLEAIKLFLKGASPRDLDTAMLDFGMPMGPLRLLDEVGLDVAAHVGRTLAKAFPDRVALPDELEILVKQGSLGKKSQRGFYLYQDGKSTTPNPDALALQQGNETPTADEISTRLIDLMSREAQLCLNEGIVASADDLNFAMTMATGFPPARPPLIAEKPNPSMP